MMMMLKLTLAQVAGMAVAALTRARMRRPRAVAFAMRLRLTMCATQQMRWKSSADPLVKAGVTAAQTLQRVPQGTDGTTAVEMEALKAAAQLHMAVVLLLSEDPLRLLGPLPRARLHVA